MIVLTGASDGLGLALAKQFSHAGKTVVNLSRGVSNYAQINIQTDLTDTKSVEAAAQEVLKLTQPIEAVINCAGVMSLEPLDSISVDEIIRVFDTNVTGHMILVSRLAKRLQKDGADIVNVASTSGTKGNKDQATYGASKWAMRGFSANLQVEFAGTLTRVISFCVGGFNSRIEEKVSGQAVENPDDWMNANDVATCLRQTLELPKNMEVSEIIINRKIAR